MNDIHFIDENGNETEQLIGIYEAASDEVAQRIINSPVGDDGRSPWMWVRLANGDLLLACYPTGDMYEATEGDRTV